jgi:VIT1/CCC1 family predicted Fe2+/Mn2+ transporter
MKNDVLSVTAFAVVILAILATLAMIACSNGIERAAWINPEGAAWACFGLAILGSILGWCSFKRPLGKVSAILGTLVVAGFLFQLLRVDSGHAPPPHIPPPVRNA